VTTRLTVVKVGGAVVRDAPTLAHVLASLTRLAERRPLLVIPGGGAFADTVRQAQAQLAFSDDAAHWMALLAMDQVAEVLAEMLPGAALVRDMGEITAALECGLTPVLAPAQWMRATDSFPHSWDVTSDSVAAFVAGALDATALVLVKRRDGHVAELTDLAFQDVVPRALRVIVLTPSLLRAFADA
jgi:aspartokinase-like uncharacterized kinase